MHKALARTTVIFDLDGTLVDTAADLAAAVNHVLVENGHKPVAPDRVRHLVGHGARRMLARGFELVTGAEPAGLAMDRHLAQFLAYYEANIAVRSKPFPHVLEAIEALRGAGAVVAVCTNKRESLTLRLLDVLSMRPLFGAIVGSDTAAAPKPDPAPVRLCLERTDAKRAVFVGDSDTDIAAATASGIPCLIAAFGYGPLETAARAFASFDDYRELPDLVRRAAQETKRA